MLQYGINHYIPIIFTSEDECLFCVDGYLIAQENNKKKLDSKQKDTIKELVEGKTYDLNYLSSVFSTEYIRYFIECRILVEIGKEDFTSRYSRSKAFYNAYSINSAHEIITSKSVLIMGCGGLGSHVAWNMVALGVLKIYLLDFDVVEESNLNRQLIYTTQDIGKKKTTILKNRLEEYNPNILIEEIDTKILSVEDMRILCSNIEIDLLIKAIDNPQECLQWVDTVCKETKTPYINGLLLDNNVAIGPTYIPDRTYGAELLPISKEETYGTSGSVCMQFYHMAAEVTNEAFKVLTGYGNLKYTNKVAFDNVITGERKITSIRDGSSDGILNNIFTFILITILLLIISSWNNNWFILTAYVITCIILPSLLYYKSVNASKIAFLNTCFFFVGNIFIQIISLMDSLIKLSFTTYLIILTLFVLLSFFALFSSISSYLLCELKRHIIRRRYQPLESVE